MINNHVAERYNKYPFVTRGKRVLFVSLLPIGKTKTSNKSQRKKNRGRFTNHAKLSSSCFLLLWLFLFFGGFCTILYSLSLPPRIERKKAAVNCMFEAQDLHASLLLASLALVLSHPAMPKCSFFILWEQVPRYRIVDRYKCSSRIKSMSVGRPDC